MVTEAQIREELKDLVVPGLTRTVGSMNLIMDVKIEEKKVALTLAAAGMTALVQGVLRAKITKIVKGLTPIAIVEVNYENVKPGVLNKIKNIVAIMSGKGGVGKSLVAGLTRCIFKKNGLQCRHSGCRYHRPQRPQDCSVLPTGRPETKPAFCLYYPSRKSG
jgi:hydrogenase maturation protease